MRYRIKRLIRNLRPELIRELFYQHELKTIPKVESKIPVEVSLLNEQNISRIAEVKKMSIATLKQRLDNGDKCFVTEKSGRLLSYHWMQSSGKHYVQQTGKWEEVNRGDAVIYHVRVHKDFRGNRINGFVYSEMLQYCQDHKYNRVWIYTNKMNASNRKGLVDLGFKVYKQTLSLKFNNHYYLLSTKVI